MPHKCPQQSPHAAGALFVVLSLSLLLVQVAAACAGFRDDPAQDDQHPRDVHSFAEPDEAYVTHVALDLRADFDTSRLHGTATLTYHAEEQAGEIVLDTRGLEIIRVETTGGYLLQHRLGEERELLGAPLRIQLPDDGSPVVIHYATGPGAEALQWLEPQQTAGGAYPFLFTQGQSIYTRSWIPTQDSPGIRQTYEAAVTVPDGLTALMSAMMLTPEGVSVPEGTTFRFRLDTPIPPYLIALAIGDLDFRSVGPRTGVWAEPTVVDEAAAEFADMPEMLAVAEELYGSYRWDRFDVLVLPPSFPFGGMENPRLTFATPTLIAGDRSLVSTIAHELAHSWSGNLVTNATWEDFWLNEGFTTYIEYRIMEAVYGADYARMLEQLGLETLRQEMERFGFDSPDTRLKIDLSTRGPEAGPTFVPYKKGAAFLRAIEVAAGRDRFDKFLRGYFEAFAFQPMTSERFLAYLEEHLIQGDGALRERIDPEAWVYRPGIPETAPTVTADAFEAVERQASAFLEGAAASDLETEQWTTHEWLHFLNLLPADIASERTRELDNTFGFSDTRNSEIRFSWLRHAIRNGYRDALYSLEEFLTSQGRAKFVVPLYRELKATDWGAREAHRIYEAARSGYHPLTAREAERVLSSG